MERVGVEIQGWVEIIKQGSIRELETLILRDKDFVNRDRHVERDDMLERSWTPLGLALNLGETGHICARMLLQAGAATHAECATSRMVALWRNQAQAQQRQHENRTIDNRPFRLPDEVVQVAVAVFGEKRTRAILSSPPPRSNGVPEVLWDRYQASHAQWSRQVGPSDEDADECVREEAPTDYSLNALGCALCFGYSIDLLVVLLRCGAFVDQEFSLRGHLWTAESLALENGVLSDLNDAMQIVAEPKQAHVSNEPFVNVTTLHTAKRQKPEIQEAIEVTTWNIKGFGHNIAGRDYAKILENLRQSDIVCVQETKWHPGLGGQSPARWVFEQMKSAGFEFVVGGKTFHENLPKAGEFPLIFYSSARFQLLGCQFLPPNCDPQSRVPFCRNPFEAMFRLKSSRLQFRVVTYHGDVSKKVRLDEMSAFGHCVSHSCDPVIICGDMNFASKREHDVALSTFNVNSRIQFLSANVECESTNNENSVRRCPFDHIWVDSSFNILSANVGFGTGMCPPLSDHRLLSAIVTFQ